MKYFWLIASFFSLFDTKKIMTKKGCLLVRSHKQEQVCELDKQRIMAILLSEYGIDQEFLRGNFENCEMLFQTTSREHNVER